MGNIKKKSNSSSPQEKEDFITSGPHHLTSVDWSCMEDRRMIAASLVNGVYTIQEESVKEAEAVDAPNWWVGFGFRLYKTLKDGKDGSTFGAIFEHEDFTNNTNGPPRYVVAFRGTMLMSSTILRDLELNAQVAFHKPLHNRRYEKGADALHELISTNKGGRPDGIWMAGHSLGAILALRIGKAMAKKGCYIDTYLFNPPFPSVPFEKLLKKRHLIKKPIQVAHNLVIGALSVAVKGKQSLRENMDKFHDLCPWVPHLFVNPQDAICSEYIGYFEARKMMEGIGLGTISRVAMCSSVVSLITEATGRVGEATHLIPSANLTKNIRSMDSRREAHGIKQWWQARAADLSGPVIYKIDHRIEEIQENE